MNVDHLRNDLKRFDPTLPIERAWTPPSSWYTDQDFYRLEQQNVFGHNWLIAARIDQVDAPRKFVCGEMAGERYVIVRGEDGELRAFYNVCRHHAAAVVQGEGSAKRLSCPYHGWTYGLDGSLLSAPETDGLEDFSPERFGLVPLAVATCGPFVFVSLGAEQRSLNDDLATLKGELDATHIDSLHFVARRTYSMKCNWKVYVDNYLDGGYHVAYLHRGLASQLDLQSYRTEIFDRFSIQSTAGLGADGKRDVPEDADGTDFAARIGDRALYAWVYPNLMINRYGPIMDTNWVIPTGPDKTDVIFDYYFADTDGKAAQEFIAKSFAASDVVQQEDVDICEAVQGGLMSRSYDQGRYSAEREMGEYRFHRLLAEDLAAR